MHALYSQTVWNIYECSKRLDNTENLRTVLHFWRNDEVQAGVDENRKLGWRATRYGL